jgi:hypothetical protein
MNDPRCQAKDHRVKSKRTPEQQQASQSNSGVGSLSVEAYVVPGAGDKHGLGRRDRGLLQWAMLVIAKHPTELLNVRRIANKSKFTRRVMKLLEREPDFVDRFPQLRDHRSYRRTVMRAWARVRTRNGLEV